MTYDNGQSNKYKVYQDVEEMTNFNKDKFESILQELKKVNEQLNSQKKTINSLVSLVGSLNDQFKKVLEGNKEIKKKMVELELLNKELTKRLETFEEMGKASDIKLNIMEIKN